MRWHERIRARRIDLGWTQRELADRAGCTGSHISLIENGYVEDSKHLPRIALAMSIAYSVISPNGDKNREAALDRAFAERESKRGRPMALDRAIEDLKLIGTEVAAIEKAMRAFVVRRSTPDEASAGDAAAIAFDEAVRDALVAITRANDRILDKSRSHDIEVMVWAADRPHLMKALMSGDATLAAR